MPEVSVLGVRFDVELQSGRRIMPSEEDLVVTLQGCGVAIPNSHPLARQAIEAYLGANGLRLFAVSERGTGKHPLLIWGEDARRAHDMARDRGLEPGAEGLDVWAIDTRPPPLARAVKWDVATPFPEVTTNPSGPAMQPAPRGTYLPKPGDIVEAVKELEGSSGAIPAGARCLIESRRVLGTFDGLQYILVPLDEGGQPAWPRRAHVDESDLLPDGSYPFKIIRAAASAEQP